MTMREIMGERSFVVVGDTLNEEKFAAKIKKALLKNNYEVQAVGKELASLNDAVGDIDVIDLCIRPDKGLELIRDCKKPFKAVVIQPGAESEELENYLRENNIAYVNDCVLAALGED